MAGSCTGKGGYAYHERMPAKHCSQNMWLVKPAALNQGRGIEVCRSLGEIKRLLMTKNVQSVWVVQKYIERPLLFNNRKFDIRVWALATAKQEFYFYQKGYLRTSSSEYDTEAKDNYIHLTNNCLQKHGDLYGAHEDGNTLSFELFQKYLDQLQCGVNVWRDLVPAIKDLMIDTYTASMDLLHVGKLDLAFELFGYDFMVDEDFRVWLIEVNTNPYLGVPNEYIGELMPQMIEDLLALTVDPHLPTTRPRSRQTNDFELIYKKGLVNKRRSFETSLYPVPELAQSPMCTHSLKNNDSGFSKQPAKDIGTQLREGVDSQLDVEELSKLCSRLFTVLKNWELYSNEQLTVSVESLHYLMAQIGPGVLIRSNLTQAFFHLCSSENLPVVIHASLLTSLALGLSHTLFKRNMIKQGICTVLIRFILNPNTILSTQHVLFSCLLSLASHPARKVYIPGETREHDYLRKLVIQAGVPACLFALRNRPEFYERVETHFNNEYTPTDWEVIKAFVKTPCEEISLADIEALSEKVQQMCDKYKAEQEHKQTKALIKKQELAREESLKKIQRLRVLEEKKKRVHEFALKRYQELVQVRKISELREKEQFAAFDELRKQQILEKNKKNEETRLAKAVKLKKQKVYMKKKQEEHWQKQQELREKAIEQWMTQKLTEEREKKLHSKAREIEKRILIEQAMYVRKLEREKKLLQGRVRQSKNRTAFTRTESDLQEIDLTHSITVMPSITTKQSFEKGVRMFSKESPLATSKLLKAIEAGHRPGRPYLQHQVSRRVKQRISP